MQATKLLFLIATIFALNTGSSISQAQLTTSPALKAPSGNLALKGPLKLDPSSPIANLPPAPSRDALDHAYDQFRRAHDSTTTARNRFVEVRAACMTRSFSVSDQQQAGCLPSDTVADCNRKLGNWCTRAASHQWRLTNRQVRAAANTLKEAIDTYTNSVTHVE